MQLDEKYIAKIDPLMEEALRQARGDEEMIAIMSLDLKKPLVKEPFHPKEFPTYEDYRKTLIEYRQKEFAEGLGDTLQELRNLSLKILTGGTISRTLAVEGTARQILQALELPEVRHATIEQMIGLPHIAPREAIDRIANIYIKTLWQNQNLEARQEDLIYQASEQYIFNYDKHHNKIQILGMTKPVDLESIYTTVRFLNSQAICRSESIEALEAIYKQSKWRSFKQQDFSPKEGLQVANEEQYLMVLGQPGSGKSTFLRKVGLEAIKLFKGEFKHDRIPVFLELKRFRNKEIDLENAIADEFRSCRFPNVEQFVERALAQGKLLILLDGLDEVPTANQERVISQIQKFVEKNERNHFIASCRTAAYQSYFSRFTEVVIAEFNDEQIQQFINNWFRSEEDLKAETAKNCWELLNRSEHEASKELARTPVLLTFICLVYNEFQELPKNRAKLYQEALDILLRKWAAQKRVEHNPILKKFGLEQEQIMLSEIAYRGFEADKLFFSHSEIISQINSFLSNNINASQQLDSEEVLNAIAIYQGILVERAQNIYSFSHLTLQEYLTAQYIVDNDKIEHLVTNHLTDKRWQEVFLLVAGLMRGGTDRLLLLMEKEAQKYLTTPVGKQRLVPLLSWADEITTGTKGDLKPVAKRAIANSIINPYVFPFADAKTRAIADANAIAYAIANACTIAYAIYAKVYADANTKTIANAIDEFTDCAYQFNQLPEIFRDVNFPKLIARLEKLRTQILDKKQLQQDHQEFAKKIIKTWLDAFHIDLKLVNLFKEELEEIDRRYFYVNWLTLQCKEAAVKVSKETWEGIEERMLRVPDE